MRVEYADVLLRELDSYAGRNLMVAMTICFGPADRLRGGLAQLLGSSSARPSALPLRNGTGRPQCLAGVAGACPARLGAAGRGERRRRQRQGLGSAGATTTATVLGMKTLAEQATSLLAR